MTATNNPLWRKEDPVIDDDGIVIKGGLFAHQREWWNQSNFVKLLVTGYGGGKTMTGCKRGIAVSLTNAPVPHVVVSPSYKMAKRTTIPTLLSLLRGKMSLLDGFEYEYLKSDHEFQIRYKGREGIIWIASGDDPDSLKGPNIGSVSRR